ncbi:MAG: pyruvate dehydrogenase complex E1 component subunit beta [Elusimicrobiales bacterium]|nr:pyruvate dehydrogenase complex E1 component subunit beta [Elusimicrobiales bacterium]
MSQNRRLSYSLAINEALHQTMAADKSVFLIGQGVNSPWYVGNTALGLLKRFGAKRVIDTPVSENGITGAAVGAAIAGMRPVVVHPRVDFMLYAIDPIINEAANWHYMSGGSGNAPVVVWGIINRGGEQAAQHSQSFHAMFAHIPGLKVVMPATPYDAKGLMVAAIKDHNPVVFMDDRWLYRDEAVVPEKIYEVPIGKAAIRRKGSDLTIVACSYLAREAVKAADELKKGGIAAEVIDLRTIKPLDTAAILRSVRKTGRLLIADGGWRSFGISAEIAAIVAEAGVRLKKPLVRLTLPDCPAPASISLEKAYYLHCADIINAARRLA